MPHFPPFLRTLGLALILGFQPGLAQATTSAEALRLLRAGQVDGALTAARASLASSPEDMDAHELIIDILINQGLALAAEGAYVQLAEDNPEAAWAWTLRGRAATTSEAALEAYARALDLDPDEARAWTGRADVERALGQTESAIANYQRAQGLDPGLADAYSGLGALYIGEDRNREALEVCQAAIVAAPSDPEAYIAAASLAPDQALDFLSKGAAAVPDEPRLHSLLGHHLLAQGQLAEARASLEQALRLWPDYPPPALDLYMLGCMERGELDAAGRDSLYRANLLGRESPLASVDSLDQLAQRYPRCAIVLAGRGRVLNDLGRAPEAEAALREALAVSDSDPELKSYIQGSLGLLLMSKQEHEEAFALLDAARDRRLSDVDLAVAAGIVRANLEGPRTGAEDLAQTAGRFPTDSRPVMALATLLSTNGDGAAALTILERAVARNPDPGLLLALAGAARDQGDLEKTARALNQLSAVTGDPHWRELAQGLPSGD